jgi:hypothetical protein
MGVLTSGDLDSSDRGNRAGKQLAATIVLYFEAIGGHAADAPNVRRTHISSHPNPIADRNQILA